MTTIATTPCIFCNGTGVLEAVRIGSIKFDKFGNLDFDRYTFRCRCGADKKLSTGKFWENQNNFLPIKFDEFPHDIVESYLNQVKIKREKAYA